jgi:ubiquinone biosynthesis protein
MTSHFGFGRALRATRRARDIFGVLIRHGFADLVEEIGLDRAWAFARRMVRRHGPVAPPHHMPEAERVRRMLEDLGPTFVKLGQVLSTRPDLVPDEWCIEFRKLQSDAPPVPFAAIDAALDAEFGARRGLVLRAVDPVPIAAASIAQVHRATLADGAEVVLKVLRPGVRETIEADVQLMRTLAGLLERRFQGFGYSPLEVVDQFARHIEAETDLSLEGRNCERLGRFFADDPRIGFPAVHWAATTRSVLALEEIQGVLLARIDPRLLAPELRCLVVEQCADAVFQQCFEIGFFHADPHPGNIFVRPDGSVCFIDCGMVGHVAPDTAGSLADLIRGTLTKDLDTVIRTAIALADAEPALAYDRRLRARVWEFMGEFEGRSLADLRVGELLQKFFELIRRHRMRCAADLVYLIKAIATIEGVALTLAPDFDLIAHVRPRIERLVRQRYGIRALRRRVERSLLGYAEVVETLPFHVREVLDRLQKRNLTLNVEHRGLDDLSRQIASASVNISYALLVSALIVGSSVLMLADTGSGPRTWITGLSVLGFLSSIGIALWRVFRLWISRR